MTKWLRSQTDPSTTQTWKTITEDYGIEVGWGDYSLFRLAFLYFAESLKFVGRVAPQHFSIVCHEDLVDARYTRQIMQTLCRRAGIDFREEMVRWSRKFGEPAETLVDGFAAYGALDGAERRFIHQTIHASAGIEQTHDGLVIAPDLVQRIDSGELGELYEQMRAAARAQFELA